MDQNKVEKLTVMIMAVILAGMFLYLRVERESGPSTSPGLPEITPMVTPTVTPPLSKAELHGACTDSRDCAGGATCVAYYGIAGPNGPEFKSCEIWCRRNEDCPEGTRCTTVADGPGQVCY